MRALVWLIGVLAGLSLLVVGLVIGTGFFLSPQDELKKADVIVAISGGETQQRTSEAIELYKNGYAPLLLFSGAAADEDSPSNAETMRQDALEQGVPDEDIIIEEESANTAENASRTAPIIEDLGAKSVILVTSPYHQRRASLDFKKYLNADIEVINHSATDSAWRKSTWWQNSYTVALTVAEVQKTIYEWTTGPSLEK